MKLKITKKLSIIRGFWSDLTFYIVIFMNAFYASLNIRYGSFFDSLQVGLGMLGFFWLKERICKFSD